MMATAPSTAPILSTPDEHIFSETVSDISVNPSERISDADLSSRYEIERTAQELIQGNWSCIALQFPDGLLSDSPRVVELLNKELAKSPLRPKNGTQDQHATASTHTDLEVSMNEVILSDKSSSGNRMRRLYILGDTSYGACCVDEIAAEHISAEVVVHYGRACLSPTSRLPVIYVFTRQPLNQDAVVSTFEKTYPDKTTEIILMTDVMYSSHIPSLLSRLQAAGYTDIYAPEVIHDPSSPIPNRSLPSHLKEDPEALKRISLFHISSPPTALLLTLSSRISNIIIYPTTASASPSEIPSSISASTSNLLRRRYGLLTSLSSASIFGILINTLSVSSYQSAAASIATQLRSAGKKSYTFVVGKINAAKVANFAEIDGWIVVGCWESSLVEADGFWKPVITPFELDVLLRGDQGRVWTGAWEGGFAGFGTGIEGDRDAKEGNRQHQEAAGSDEEDDGSEDESAPPEFDLRTGRYVSAARPLATRRKKVTTSGETSQSLMKRDRGDMAVIGNEISPGAGYLRTQRTWRGLGSDIQIEYEADGQESGTLIEEGRSGIARGYANEQ